MDRHKGSTQLERLEVVETGRRRRPIGAQSEQSGFARVVLAAEVEPAVAATPASGQMVIIAGRDRRVIVDVTSSAGAGQPGHSPCARRSVQPEDRDRGPGTGDYIAERDYRSMKKGGRTPIVPDAKGNNTVLVDTWAHANPMADRIRRQVTEGSVIQATGRGRLGQRSEINPLDIHLWNDGPLPELGPVEPVLWDEIAVGLDELMLATGGVWLENVTHAAKAYRGLLSAKSLQQARWRAQTPSASGQANAARARSHYIAYYKYIIGNVVTPRACGIAYQLGGSGQKPAQGYSLLGLRETKAWLEERLRSLVKFDVIESEAPASATAE